MERTTPKNTVSTIQVTFHGMMMLFINDDSTVCQVGILKHAPDHEALIEIEKVVNEEHQPLHSIEGPDFQPRMWLDVQKNENIIAVYHGEDEINRGRDTGDDYDFDWVLDFEGDLMYKRRVSVDKPGFRTILSINDGTFFTAQKSGNTLKLKKPGKGKDKGKVIDPDIGRVATKVGLRIYLADGENASFFNGVDEIPLPPARNTNYKILVKLARPEHHRPALDEVADAENYYTAVAGNVAPSKRIHFEAGTGKNDPDSRCLMPTLSQSEIP